MGLLHRTACVLVTLFVCSGHGFPFQSSKAKVLVEFRWAETTPAKGLTEVKVPGTNEKVYLHKRRVLSNKDIVEARSVDSVNLLGGRSLYVEVVFTKAAARRMTRATQHGNGKLLVILIDGRIVTALTIHGMIYDRASISSESMTKEQADTIAAALNR